MIQALFHPALQAFDPLPLLERAFVRARLFSAPLETVAARVTGQRVLDVGCGHGVLTALVAHAEPSRKVVGIDLDERKIDWALRSVGRLPNVELRALPLEALDAAPFDTICIADVLYLLPVASWPRFFSECRSRLVPGGRLLLKETEDDGSWRVPKALLQEQVMVRLLGRTHSSGAVGISAREAMVEALKTAGFRVDEAVSLSRWSTTPHVLFVAHSA